MHYVTMEKCVTQFKLIVVYTLVSIWLGIT